MNTSIKTIERKIYINEKLIELEYPVLSFLIYGNNKIIILLDFKNDIEKDNNVYCLDEFGEILWKIQSGNYPNGKSNISSIYVLENKLFVYRNCGIEEEINVNNGLVKNSELIK